SATRDALEKVVASALRMASAAGVTTSEEVGEAHSPGTADLPTEAATTADGSTTTQPSGAINTRRDALLQLQKVAEFFRRTEPHSPVAYLAERAARWGNMPLHVWLKTVLKEDNPALGNLQELLGVGGGDEETP